MRQVLIQFLGQDKSLGKTSDQARSRVSKLGSSMAKVGKIAAVGLAAGVGVAGYALYDMGKAAAEDEASQKRLARTLKNTTGATAAQVGAVEDWISAQGRALGVADDELRPALQKLVSATNDVGEAQKLASLAMDVSAGTGKSLEQVSTALMKAQNGQVSGLARLGINVKDAEGKTVDFEEAQRRLAKTFNGQAADGANTLEGKMGRLKLIFDETKETIGAALLPAATKLADWFIADGLPKMEKFGNSLAKKLGPTFSQVRDNVDAAMPAFKELGRFLGEVLPPLFEKITNAVTTVLPYLRELGRYIGENLPSLLQTLRDAVNRIFGGISIDIGGALEGIKQILGNAVTIIKSIWSTFGDTILSTLSGVLSNVVDILNGAFTIVRGIFQTISALLKGDWRGVWEGVKTILRGAVKVIGGVVRGLWAIIKGVFRAGGILLKNMVRTTLDGTVTLFRLGVTKMVELIRGLPGQIVALGGKFLNAGKTLIGKFFAGLKKLGDIGATVGKGLINGVIDGINAGIGAVNGAIPDKLGLGKFSVNLPDDPFPKLKHLASGTSRFAGGTAVLGEHGRELATLPGGARVYPAHRTEAMFASARRGAAAGVNDETPMLVQLFLDGKFIEQSLIRHQRRTNRPIQIKVAYP